MKKSLRKDSLDDFAVDIGEAVVTALEAVGEFFVIEAQEMHPGGLEVVDVDGVLRDREAEVIGGSVGGAGLGAAAGHDHGVAVREMVAAQNATLGGAPFAEGGSPKLAPEHDERVVEQSPLAKVFQQGRNRAVHGPAFVGETIADVFRRTRAMEIPTPIEELDIPDALLDQSARQKAVVGEARVAGFGTVGL